MIKAFGPPLHPDSLEVVELGSRGEKVTLTLEAVKVDITESPSNNEAPTPHPAFFGTSTLKNF
jgi:hypothetical protein